MNSQRRPVPRRTGRFVSVPLETPVYGRVPRVWCFGQEREELVREELAPRIARYLEAEYRSQSRRYQELIERCRSLKLTDLVCLAPKPMPWILVDSRTGGYADASVAISLLRGRFAVCSAKTNHAVMRARGSSILLTAKAGPDWDEDADWGHESAHASVAGLDYVSQEIESLSHGDIAKVLSSDLRPIGIKYSVWEYVVSEAIVSFVREERRLSARLPRLDSDDAIRAAIEFPRLLLGRDHPISSFCSRRVDSEIDELTAYLALASSVIRQSQIEIAQNDSQPF